MVISIPFEYFQQLFGKNKSEKPQRNKEKLDEGDKNLADLQEATRTGPELTYGSKNYPSGEVGFQKPSIL